MAAEGRQRPPKPAEGRRGLPKAAEGRRRPPRAAEGRRAPPSAAERRRGPPMAAEGRVHYFPMLPYLRPSFFPVFAFGCLPCLLRTFVMPHDAQAVFLTFARLLLVRH